MRQPFHPRARFLLLAVAAGGSACAPATPPAVPPPVAPAERTTPAAPSGETGLYTQAQAERGRRTFDAACSPCHGLGEFRGRMFQLTWGVRPIGHFFQHISTAMPQDNPGSLSPDEYASVVAYVLQLNGHPAGSRELSPELRALDALAWPR